MAGCLIWQEYWNMTGKTFWSVSFFKVGLHMHTVPQNKDKFTINNLFYCCEGLIFTQPLVYEFLCGLIFMAHPVTCLEEKGSVSL